MSNTQKPKANKSAQQRAEVAGEGYTVEYDGHAYTVPPSEEWDIEVVEAFEENRTIAVLKGLLGPEQWATFKQNSPKAKNLAEFLEALGEVMGSGNR